MAEEVWLVDEASPCVPCVALSCTFRPLSGPQTINMLVHLRSYMYTVVGKIACFSPHPPLSHRQFAWAYTQLDQFHPPRCTTPQPVWVARLSSRFSRWPVEPIHSMTSPQAPSSMKFMATFSDTHAAFHLPSSGTMAW